MIPAPSDAERQSGLAELRALRAYYYWILFDNFGDIPLITTMSQDLPEKHQERMSHDFVVRELNEVIPALNEEQGGKCMDASTNGQEKPY